MVPAAFRNKPDEVLAVVLFGAELGIGPMQSLQQINFVAGKPSAAAELLRALVMEQGHQFILDGDSTSATAQCKRKDWDEWRETTFTISDAQRAGLSGDNWRKYPDAMLAARVTSKACRLYFPDVISGMSYTPEEVESFSPPAARPRLGPVTTRRESRKDETGEVATEDQTYALKTSLSLLDEDDRSTVKARWIDAGLPSLASGLTSAQAEAALQLVAVVLNAVSDDGADAEVVEVTESTEPTTPASEVASPLATKIQVKAIQTLFGKLDIAGPAKHEGAAAIIGVPSITSMNDLTKSEASRVIDELTSRVTASGETW
jgi:hypothetical protein